MTPLTPLDATLLFLAVAIVAGRLEGVAADIAKVCVLVFLVLFVVSLFFGRKPKA